MFSFGFCSRAEANVGKDKQSRLFKTAAEVFKQRLWSGEKYEAGK